MSRPQTLGGVFTKPTMVWPHLPRLLAGQIYPTVPSDVDVAEVIGGRYILDLYALTVTAPTTQTWYLAERDLSADELFTGSPACLGLIEQSSGALVSVGDPSITLTLRDQFATFVGGPRKRFSDWFALPVSGYSVPYDLASATLDVYLAWEGLAQLRQVGRYRIQRESTSWDAGPPQTMTLTFGADRVRIFRSLPRRTITAKLWANAPDNSLGLGIPAWFGENLLVPLIPVDPQQGLYMVGESPTDTTLPAVPGAINVIQRDPDTNEDKAIAITPLPNVAFPTQTYDPVAAPTWRDLTARARRLGAPPIGLIYQVKFRMREKIAGGATPLGRVSIRIETDANGQPSGTLAAASLALDFDAATVLTDGFYPNSTGDGMFFDPPAVVPVGKPVWMVVRHQIDAGSDTIQVAVDATGGDADGCDATLATTDNDWVAVGSRRDMRIGTGLSGDGYIVRPGSKGTPEVFDSSRYRDGWSVVYAGLEVRGGALQAMRAFFRFPIANLASGVASAFITIKLQARQSPLPTGNIIATEISDFSTLDNSDWDATPRSTLSDPFCTPSVDPVTHLDVTTRYNQAKTDGLSYFSLKLTYGDEAGTTPGWYTFWAGGSQFPPILTVISSAGDSTRYSLDMVSPVWSNAYADADGERVGMITLQGTTGQGIDMGNQRLALRLDGLQDTNGNFGTAPGTTIKRHASIVRWIAFHRLALALNLANVDTAAIDLLDQTLGSDWTDAWGAVLDVDDAAAHLARLLQGAKSFVFLDYLGRLSVGVDRMSTDPVLRRVRPWEHGPIRLSQQTNPDGQSVYPVTQIAVAFTKDFLNLQQPRGHSSKVSGYIGYSIISSDQTDPADPTRQAEAVALNASYGGLLTQQSPGGVPDAQTLEWIPPETPANPTGSKVRDWLWDHNITRPKPFDWVEVELPRFALTWRVLSEISLESFAFPSSNSRYLRGECGFAAGAVMSDTPLPAFYQARRGRFSVQSIALLGSSGNSSGDAWPVKVTAKLLAWETD